MISIQNRAYNSGVFAWFSRSNEFEVANDNSYTSLMLLDCLKEIRIELEDTDWETWRETSN